MRILRLLFFPALSLLSAFSFFFFLSLTRPYLSLLEKKNSTFLKKKKKNRRRRRLPGPGRPQHRRRHDGRPRLLLRRRRLAARQGQRGDRDCPAGLLRRRRGRAAQAHRRPRRADRVEIGFRNSRKLGREPRQVLAAGPALGGQHARGEPGRRRGERGRDGRGACCGVIRERVLFLERREKREREKKKRKRKERERERKRALYHHQLQPTTTPFIRYNKDLDLRFISGSGG